jgi:hypothetical protein
MVPQRETLMAALFAGAAALGASLLFPTYAHAQAVGAAPVITVPGSVTQDLIVEHSVTTPSIGNNYQPNTQTIASLDAGLFTAVNPQNFTGTNGVFPGWLKLPQDSTDYASQLTATMLATYQGAFNDVQQQAAELEAENFAPMAAHAAGETALLAESQDTTAALWQIVNELRLLRQQINTLTTVEIVDHADILNEKARMAATAAGLPIP